MTHPWCTLKTSIPSMPQDLWGGSAFPLTLPLNYTSLMYTENSPSLPWGSGGGDCLTCVPIHTFLHVSYTENCNPQHATELARGLCLTCLPSNGTAFHRSTLICGPNPSAITKEPSSSA